VSTHQGKSIPLIDKSRKGWRQPVAPGRKKKPTNPPRVKDEVLRQAALAQVRAALAGMPKRVALYVLDQLREELETRP
jgi:hypothetical protein